MKESLEFVKDRTSKEIQQLREMRPIYARLQAEKRHGTIENAIININTLEDDIKNNNVDNSGDDYISTQDKKLLNNLNFSFFNPHFGKFSFSISPFELLTYFVNKL